MFGNQKYLKFNRAMKKKGKQFLQDFFRLPAGNHQKVEAERKIDIYPIIKKD